jgi:ABC-type nitrate/sulfonate/bicarbonate transport system substrate-binding protein
MAANMRSILLRAAVIAGLTAILAACASPSAAPKPSSLTKLTVSLSSISYPQLAIVVAKDAGIFAKNGLDVEYILGPNGLKAEVAGDVQIAISSAEEVILADQAGGNLILAASGIPYLVLDFLVRPEIKSVADLKGKPVGMTARGTVTETVLNIVAQRGGFNAAKDWQPIEIGSSDRMVTSLTSGVISGAALSAPTSDVALAQGNHVLYMLSDEHIPYPSGNTIVTRDWAQKNGDTLTAYLRSVAEALQMYRTKPDYVASEYTQWSKSDEAAGKRAVQLAIDNVPIKQLPTLDGVKAVQTILAQRSPDAAGMDPTQLFDDQYIKKLDAEGFYAKLAS